MNAKHDAEFKKLLRGMGKLPQNIQKNIMTGANRAAAAVIRDEARATAPQDEGTLKKAITVKKLRSKKRTDTIHAVAVTYGRGAKHNSWYASFLEFGTAHFAARPFMRPAMEKKLPQTVEAARAYMFKRTAKEIIKIKAG